MNPIKPEYLEVLNRFGLKPDVWGLCSFENDPTDLAIHAGNQRNDSYPDFRIFAGQHLSFTIEQAGDFLVQLPRYIEVMEALKAAGAVMATFPSPAEQRARLDSGFATY